MDEINKMEDARPVEAIPQEEYEKIMAAEQQRKEEEYKKYEMNELLRKLHKYEATYVNEFFIQILDGGALYKLSLVDRHSDLGDRLVKGSVILTQQGLFNLANTISGLMQTMAANLQQQAVQRNREETPDLEEGTKE